MSFFSTFSTVRRLFELFKEELRGSVSLELFPDYLSISCLGTYFGTTNDDEFSGIGLTDEEFA